MTEASVGREGKETTLQDCGRGAPPALPNSWVILSPAELASQCMNHERSAQIPELRGHLPVLKEFVKDDIGLPCLLTSFYAGEHLFFFVTCCPIFVFAFECFIGFYSSVCSKAVRFSAFSRLQNCRRSG